MIIYLIAIETSPLSNALGAEGEVASIRTEMAVYVVILLGVVVGSVLRRLVAAYRVGNVSNPLEVIGKAFTGIEFAIGVVGSPILYGLLIGKIERAPTDVFYWLAFQNGLFAPILIGQFMGNPPAAHISRSAAAEGSQP